MAVEDVVSAGIAFTGVDFIVTRGLGSLGLSDHCKRVMAVAFASNDVAVDLANAIETGSTLSNMTKRSLPVALCDQDVASEIIAKITSGVALSAHAQGKLTACLCDADACKEIATAIGGA